MGDKVHDFVVFALRPEAGFIADRYLDYLASEPGDERLDPAWYLSLQPDIDPENQRQRTVPINLWSPDPPQDPGRLVTIEVRPKERAMLMVQWVTNEFGEETPRPRVVSDPYKRNQKLDDNHKDKIDLLPDPDEFKLVPMRLTELTPVTADGSADTGDDHP